LKLSAQPKARRKTGPKFNKVQRAQLAAYAWKMRVEYGWTLARIVDGFKKKFGHEVSISLVSQVLTKSTANARQKVEDMALQTIFEQSEQADMIFREAMREYRRKRKTRDGGEVETARDPSYLNTALKAMDHKAKIQGAYVDKLELSGPGGGPIAMDDARSDLARRLAAHAAAAGSGRVDSESDDPPG